MRAGVRLGRPVAHLVKTGRVRVDISDCFGRACLRTCRITSAKIAFDHFAGIRLIVHRAERTRNRADLAANTQRIVDHLRPIGINRNRIRRTRLLAPRFIALRAGVRNKPALILKLENLNPGLDRIENTLIFPGTSQYTLITTSALVWIYM